MTDVVVRETALYRFFDHDGNLLYIGITYDIAARFRQHAANSAWWALADLDRTEVEWVEDRQMAEALELVAIGIERPAFNLVVPDEKGRQMILPRQLSDEGTFAGRNPAEIEELIKRLSSDSRSADFHTPIQRLRAPKDRWQKFGEVVGNRGRSAELNAYMEARIAGTEPRALMAALMRWIAVDPAAALSALAPYVQKEAPPTEADGA